MRVYRNTSASVHCNASMYTVSLRMRSTGMFVFKFLKIIYRYVKWSGTWNMFLLRSVHTVHDMSIDMSVDIVAPQMSIIRRRLHLNRHVVQQNHSTLKIYYYRNKKQPSFFSVYPTQRRPCWPTYVHTAVYRSTFFVKNRQNLNQLDMSIDKKILYETCRHDV